MPTAVDRLEVLVLVDNVTDYLSTVPGYVETEVASYWRRGMRLLSGKCLCCAAHGLSCLITAHRSGGSHTLLFDTGPEEWVFERKAPPPTWPGYGEDDVFCFIRPNGAS
jgi:7,8-dihydropterin-6-yl-methyl-4-(beta-D-ribofuranosyl)aminobenzene 5'-phosphate synthase